MASMEVDMGKMATQARILFLSNVKLIKECIPESSREDIGGNACLNGLAQALSIVVAETTLAVKSINTEEEAQKFFAKTVDSVQKDIMNIIYKVFQDNISDGTVFLKRADNGE